MASALTKKDPVDIPAPVRQYRAMLGETQKPVLPHPRSAECARRAKANQFQMRAPPPLRVTLVHHDETVHAVVAELAGAQHWRLEAYRDFADAIGALGPPLPANSDTPPASAPSAAAGPRVILAALGPPGVCGLEWTRRLAALGGSPRLVLLAGPDDAALGLSAIYSGASAFVLLPPNRAEILTAIHWAAGGRRFLPAAVQQASLDALCCPEPAPSCTGLTPTEIRVLWAMGQGRGEKGASRLLPMKLDTTHAHAKHIYLKLGVHSLPEALEKIFGRHGCAYTCLRRERERERERSCQEEELTESWVRDDDSTASQPYPSAYPKFVGARPVGSV